MGSAKGRWAGNLQGVEQLLEELEEQEAEEAVAKGRREIGIIFQPTDEQRRMVKQLAQAAMPLGIIALMVKWPDTNRPVSINTLTKYFEDELTLAKVEMGVNLAGAAYKKAMSGDTGMLCFLLKTQFYYRETNRTEVTGPNGAPLPQNSGVLMVPSPVDMAAWEEAVTARQRQLAAQTALDVAGGYPDSAPEEA